MTVLFVDTNVLLHYRRLEEVDWLSIAKVSDAVLVLPPIVIRELDRHKTQHPQKKYRKRAQEITKDLHARILSDGSPLLRAKVRLEAPSFEPRIDFANHGLDKELADDWLVASAIEWRQQHINDDVRIVTGDLGMALKARAHGIATISPLESDKLPDELDANERTIRELQKEIAELTNIRPELKLFFYNSDPNHIRQVKIRLATDFDLVKAEGTLRGLRSQFSHLAVPDEKAEKAAQKKHHKLLTIPIKPNFDGFRKAMEIPVTRDEVEKYNSELDLFFKNYEEYLHLCHARLDEARRMVLMEIGLTNIGTAPAEGVDVHMHFPSGFYLFDEAKNPLTGPEAPTPPPKPGQMRVPFHPISSFPDLSRLGVSRAQVPRSPPNISKPSIEPGNSFDVRSTVRSAKHGYNYPLGRFVAAFKTDASIKSFEIDYEILANNLPKPTQGSLSVVIEVGG